jgi:Icc-related predicted phosphoesterase
MKLKESIMKLVCMSDLHCKTDMFIPSGDVLVVAGDITGQGEMVTFKRIIDSLAQTSHPHKILVAGNHDFCFENENRFYTRDYMAEAGITYLEHSFVTIEDKVFFGSPYVPIMGWAFGYDRYSNAGRRRWECLPDNIDVLITHGPPSGIRDFYTRSYGCPHLYQAVQRIKPKFHIFGHIHDGYGITETEHTTFVNCSLMNEEYELTNKPIVVEI